MFYRPTYTSLRLLSTQWLEINVSHCCYANYWNEKKITSPSPTGEMKRNEPFGNFQDILPKNQKNELVSWKLSFIYFKI
jgi:hypothetical protein